MNLGFVSTSAGAVGGLSVTPMALSRRQRGELLRCGPGMCVLGNLRSFCNLISVNGWSLKTEIYTNTMQADALSVRVGCVWRGRLCLHVCNVQDLNGRNIQLKEYSHNSQNISVKQHCPFSPISLYSV